MVPNNSIRKCPSTRPHFELFTLSLAHAPSSGTPCASGTLSLAFSSRWLSSSCRCPCCQSFGRLPRAIVPIVDFTYPHCQLPSSTAISSISAISIDNSSIPLVPSAISHSHGSPSAGSLSGVTPGFCASSCVSCGILGTSGEFSRLILTVQH